MLESVARTKWCPFARQSTDGRSAANRWGSASNVQTTHAVCLGSVCMMWLEIPVPESPPHGDCSLKTRPVAEVDSLTRRIFGG